jgi:CubicO group peptidase (beta-lactamase class C family)
VGFVADDWQVGPRNRWTYQHVGEVLPTVVVSRGDSARALPPGEPIKLPDPPYLDGLAVLREGALVLERYANGMQPHTRHLSQSVAKSVLGLLVTVLELDPDTPVADLVPEVARSGYRGATLRHLLDMTAATDFVEDYLNFWRYDAACGWHPPHPGVPGSILEYLTTRIGPIDRPHGAAFHYASPNTDLLGIAAGRAANAPLQDLIATHLWDPIGAAHDAEIAVDPTGTPVISGGFCATLLDYTRLGAFVLDNDFEHLGERQIEDPRAIGYGSQWWRLTDDTTAARGIHGQLIAVDRSTRTVTTILSSWPTATDPDAEAAQFELIQALR